MSSLVNKTQLGYFAQEYYDKMKESFDAKGSAAAVETNAKNYVDGLNSTMDGRMNTVESAINVLNGNENTQGSVAYQIAQLVAGADASFDTLKEIADWIVNDTIGATQMANDIKSNQTAIADLEKLVGTIPSDATATDIVGYIAEYVEAQLQASDLSQYAKATDLEETDKKVKANEDAIAVLNGADTVTGSVAKAVKDGVAEAKTYANELNTAMESKVTTVEGTVAQNTQNISANASDIATLQTDVTQAQADISANTQAITQNKTDLEAYADQAEADARAYADSLAVNYATAAQGATADANAQAIVELQTDVSANTTNITNLQTSIGSNATDISGLTARVEALEVTITNAEIDAIIAGLQ